MLATLSATAELMLNEVMGAILASTYNQDIKEKLASIFSIYDIKPAALPNGHPDLREKIQLFLAGKRLEGLSELTLKGYALDLRIFAEHVQKAAADITTADIRMYLGEFDNLKTSSLSGKLSVLKSFFGWLTSEGILLNDQSRKIKSPKKEKRLPKALNIEEVEMIREACVTPRERAMIEVYYATGCRLSEVQQMDRDDINYQAMSAKVIGKGNKERIVYFSHKAIYHLKKYLMRRTDDEPALFITERKPYRRLSNRGIQREVKIIADRSGVKKNVHPHVLRHTFATLLLNNGADLVSVQGLLGHEDPATTQIYAQVTDEKRKSAHKQFLVQ
ncbi:tyrosine-type recombinase/integrase [Paradesulfitobacterium aromaticivorans]